MEIRNKMVEYLFGVKVNNYTAFNELFFLILRKNLHSKSYLLK